MLLLISVFTCLCLNIYKKLYQQIETLFLRIDSLPCISFMSLGMLLSLSKTYVSVYTHTHTYAAVASVLCSVVPDSLQLCGL